MVVKIDKLGRVVIPISFRRMLGFSENTELEIGLENNKIVICRPPRLCKLCGVENNFAIGLCMDCINKVKSVKIEGEATNKNRG